MARKNRRDDDHRRTRARKAYREPVLGGLTTAYFSADTDTHEVDEREPATSGQR